jgi:hypothetical protein
LICNHRLVLESELTKIAQIGGIANWEYVLSANVSEGGTELQVARWRERENESHAAEHDRFFLRVIGRLAGRRLGSFNTYIVRSPTIWQFI